MHGRFNLRKPLGNLLVEQGWLDQPQLEQALDEQRRSREPLGQILLRKGWISKQALYRLLAQQQNVPLVFPDDLEIPPELLRRVDGRFAREQQVLPFKESPEELHVALAHPSDLALLDELRFRTGKRIVPYLAPEDEILQALERVEDRLEEVSVASPAPRVGPSILEETAPTVELAENLLQRALRARATDLHLEPQANFLLVRMRVDGVMQEVARLSKDLEASLIARYKVLGQMDIAERRRPQDGHFTYSFAGQDYDIRLSSMGAVFGERMALRLIQATRLLLGLEDLGVFPEDLPRLEQMFRAPYGLVLAVGPTGSGKTTTLYAALRHIHTPEKNFFTIEDPVEIALEGISQIPVQPKIGMDFDQILRSVLRQDPDVIMIGEIRDQTTLQTAVRAALTGHLVLATLHANNAIAAISRLMEMGTPAHLVGATLVGVIAQRLVRRPCPQCARISPIPTELQPAFTSIQSEMRGLGCAYCGQTGYYGLSGLYEVYLPDTESRHLMATGASENLLRQQAQGHKTLWQVAGRAVQEGLTTSQEVVRVLGWGMDMEGL